MIFLIFFVLLFGLVFGQGSSDRGFNRALWFPGDGVTYTSLDPDFSEASDAISVCSWLKLQMITVDLVDLPWFSYGIDDPNLILLNAKNLNMLHTTSGSLTVFDFGYLNLVEGEWYNFCFTWEPKNLDFYINSVKIYTTDNVPAGQIIQGGTLWLGSNRANPSDIFAGQMYNINVFKKKLSLEDVTAMYYRGMCAPLSRSVGYDVVLSWQDIVDFAIVDDVIVVHAGCNKTSGLRELMDITEAPKAKAKFFNKKIA